MQAQFNNAEETLAFYLQNKKEFIRFLKRKGYYMPTDKADILTIKFCDQVFREEVFCPKQRECHPIQIADPPTRDQLRDILCGLLVQAVRPDQIHYRRLREHLLDRSADMAWLTSVIYAVHHDNPIFAENYVHRPILEPAPKVIDPRVQAYADAFNDHPVPRGKNRQKKVRRAVVLAHIKRDAKVSKAQRLNQQMRDLRQENAMLRQQEMPPRQDGALQNPPNQDEALVQANGNGIAIGEATQPPPSSIGDAINPNVRIGGALLAGRSPFVISPMRSSHGQQEEEKHPEAAGNGRSPAGGVQVGDSEMRRSSNSPNCDRFQNIVRSNFVPEQVGPNIIGNEHEIGESATNGFNAMHVMPFGQDGNGRSSEEDDDEDEDPVRRRRNTAGIAANRRQQRNTSKPPFKS